MKRDNRIYRAIDESLDSVHFNARDTYAVLNAVRNQGASHRAPKRRMRLDLIFAACMAALILVPLSVFALRAQRASIADITQSIDPIIAASSGEQAGRTQDTALPDGDTAAETKSAFSPAISESEAIQAARACFEALCDTTVFTFEEYTVDVQAAFPYGSDPAQAHYEVTMKSIYDNGCTFTVVVSAHDGRVVSHSTPKLATVPTFIDSQSAEIRAWYDKYGEDRTAWPTDMQAEFSRRYEGAAKRAGAAAIESTENLPADGLKK